MHESNKKSRCILSTNNWVHDFIKDPNKILLIKLEGKGQASFKVVDTSWYVGLGDFILTMSKDNKNKVIYQITAVDMSRKVKVGIMEDLCALGKVGERASKAVLMMDTEARAEYNLEQMEKNNATYM